MLFGYPVGAEAAGLSFTAGGRVTSGWDLWLVPAPGQKSQQHAYGDSFVRYFSSPKIDPAMDTTKFDFEKDLVKFADARTLLNATDPDLSSFRARGGKLLMYFGWADTALAPMMGVDYYEKAMARNGADTPEFFRLFMVPGMYHCAGGVGPNLHGVIGRKAGEVADFRYSPAMKRSGVTWSERELDAYIAEPQKKIPGNRMPYSGMPEARDRADLIAYLMATFK